MTLLGLIAPGLATGLGGAALLVFRRPRELTLDTLLGFTAVEPPAALAAYATFERAATLALVCGFALMMGLDNAFG